jgi:hypothetical protein
MRCFIASWYPYQYLFLKKSIRNKKAYSITIVINAVQHLFSPFNFFHIICSPIISDYDEIFIDNYCCQPAFKIWQILKWNRFENSSSNPSINCIL